MSRPATRPAADRDRYPFRPFGPIVACLGYIRDMVVPPAWDSPESFAELISAKVIANRVAELGAQITADYAPLTRSSEVVVIGVLKGSVIFLADLVRHIA